MSPITNPNRIAFVAANGQLGTVAPDGRDLRMLTTGERTFQFPAWSPDNEAIAAIGSTEHDAGIYVVHEQTLLFDVAVQQLYRSHTQPPIYLSWSPNSQWLSFLTIHATSRLALYLTTRDGLSPVTNDSKPVIAGQPCFWQWQADSQGFLVHADLGRDNARLAFVKLQNGETTLHDLGIQPGDFQVPSLSADNQQWAYAERRVDFAESRLTVASQTRKQWLTDYQGTAALSWNPVTAQLVFIHPSASAQHIYGPLYLWDAASDTVQPLVEENVVAFFWSPDGQKLAYLTLAARAQRPLLKPPTFVTNGRFTGNWPFMNTESQPELRESLRLTLHVIDVQSGRAQTLAVFEPWALFVNQFLPFFDQYAVSHRLWSPNSDALVVPMVKGHTAQIYVVPINGGPAQPVAEGFMATWSW
ncbi:PD40 domain-containing protein [soil metagenome]